MSNNLLADKKIILAEDDALLAQIITKKLEQAGATVIPFINGADCLAAITTEKPDLVLLDIDLPGLNGYEVLHRLYQRDVTPTLPVIIISNSGQVVEIEKILQLGVRDYIIKAQLEPEEILEKIYNSLGIKHRVDTPSIIFDMQTPEPVAQSAAELVKVLVVEDDPLLRNMLSVKLSMSHCPCMFSNDGLQALELVSQFEPQVILLDLMIPGKDGFAVLTDLKAHPTFKDIPVIIFSNKSGDDEKAKAHQLGAHSFRQKALTDLNELVAELRGLALKRA